MPTVDIALLRASPFTDIVDAALVLNPVSTIPCDPTPFWPQRLGDSGLTADVMTGIRTSDYQWCEECDVDCVQAAMAQGPLEGGAPH